MANGKNGLNRRWYLFQILFKTWNHLLQMAAVDYRKIFRLCYPLSIKFKKIQKVEIASPSENWWNTILKFGNSKCVLVLFAADLMKVLKKMVVCCWVCSLGMDT